MIMSCPAFIAALPNEIQGLRKKMKIDLTIDVKPGKAYRGILGERPLLLSYSGIGRPMAEQHTRFLVENFPITHIIAIGFAGATIPRCNTGELIIAPTVENDVKELGSFASNPALLHLAESQAKAKRIKHRVGNILTVAKPLTTVNDKMMAYRNNNATAVDMESGAIAKVAQENNIPFLAARAIFDTLDATPPEGDKFLNDDYEISMGKVLGFAITQPNGVVRFPQWGRWSNRAQNTLTRFVENLNPMLA
jgi:adenosylhomocysteine nucleosidase